MSFFAITFLWSSLLIGVPILIAFWNRKKIRREKFGGYFLLRKLAESTKRRIQILQILKLLNRIILFLLIILCFAEPLVTRERFSGAGEGFALILDVGRAMQGSGHSGSLIEQQKKKYEEILSGMPSESQGLILFASDRCETLSLAEGRVTASSEDWLDFLRPERISYSNEPTTISGLSQCRQRAKQIFSDRDVFVGFISALPDSLKKDQLSKMDLNLFALEVEPLSPVAPVELTQEIQQNSVRVFSDSASDRDWNVIQRTGLVEKLGRVGRVVDLLPSKGSWLWLNHEEKLDPWVGQDFFRLQSLAAKRITLWSEKESEGYLSLMAALRSHPEIQVVRQIGGHPAGEAVIIYGAYTGNFEGMPYAWVFGSPNSASAFKIRDKKQWMASDLSGDVRKSFLINTEDGEIFVKAYNLFDLDNFEVIESFEDGAPSLLEYKNPQSKIWVTPFDLEDLTTDLALEPVFIPYLYRRLERWLSTENLESQDDVMKAVWLLPGRIKPVSSVLARRAWPGIYGTDQRTIAVAASAPPSAYLKMENIVPSERSELENLSLRDRLLPWVIVSAALELLLCAISAQWGLLLTLILGVGLASVDGSQAQDIAQRIALGVIPGTDPDRLRALNQFTRDMESLCNLDFAPTEVAQAKDYWKYALIFSSSTAGLPEFSEAEVGLVRDYLDRGGLLIFDDPLASLDTIFARSVVALLKRIFPGRFLESIPTDDVLFRTFYLLNEVSGRRLASPNLQGLKIDQRWVVVFSSNDLLGAVLKLEAGDYALSVSPYGIMQRRLASRQLLNLFMYSVTVDYKDDAIHLPHILQKRVK